MVTVFLTDDITQFRQFCMERNIPYRHFPTLTDNFMSTVAHLSDMGHNSYPDMRVKMK